MKKIGLFLLFFVFAFQLTAQDFSYVTSPEFQNSSNIDKLVKLSEFSKQRKLPPAFVKQYSSRILFLVMMDEFQGKNKSKQGNTPGRVGRTNNVRQNASSRDRQTANSRTGNGNRAVTMSQFKALDAKLSAKNIRLFFEPSTYNYLLINAMLKDLSTKPTVAEKIKYIKNHNSKMKIFKVTPSYMQILAVENINMMANNPVQQLNGLKDVGHPTDKSLERYFFYKANHRLIAGKQPNHNMLNSNLMKLLNERKLSKFGAADLQRDIFVWVLIRDRGFMSMSKQQRQKRLDAMQKEGKLSFFAKSTMRSMFAK